MFRMQPPLPASRIRFPTSYVMCTVPFRSVFRTLYQSLSCSSMSSSSFTQLTPALFTRISMVPKLSHTCSTAFRTLSRSVTSQEKLSYFPPYRESSSSASAAFFSSRHRMAIFAPLCAIAEAIPKPRPRLPPVITAFFPFRLNALLMSLIGCIIQIPPVGFMAGFPGDLIVKQEPIPVNITSPL